MDEVEYPNKFVLFTSNLLFLSKVERNGCIVNVNFGKKVALDDTQLASSRSHWLYCECKFWKEVR